MTKILKNFEEYLLLILFPAMVVVVFVATVARYLNLFPMYWSEEVARYIMVYLAYTGIAAGVKQGAHISVSFLVDRIRSRALRFAFTLFRLVVILLFAGIITWLMYGLIQRLIGMKQTSPALFLPIWIMYAAVPYGMILLGIRTIQVFIHDLRIVGRSREDAAASQGPLTTPERHDGEVR